MKLELTEAEAQQVLILVRDYRNHLNSSKLPVRMDTIEFYDRLYARICQQIVKQKEGAEHA